MKEEVEEISTDQQGQGWYELFVHQTHSSVTSVEVFRVIWAIAAFADRCNKVSCAVSAKHSPNIARRLSNVAFVVAV